LRPQVCISWFLALIASAGLPVRSYAQNDIEMIRLTSLPSDAPAGQVLNANPADRDNWPATFIFKNPIGEYCTATAVGARVVLTAAHCILDDTKGVIEADKSDATLTCNRHPAFDPLDWKGRVLDFALCVSDKPLAAPKRGFETINNNTALLGIGDHLVLLGFGCITNVENERTFGTLYEGWADIQSLPSDEKTFIRTKGGAAVCFGDSGGGAFKYLDDRKTVRRLIGVNAQGDIDTMSSLATTASEGFLQWSADWSKRNSASICGVDPATKDCRK
jgi:hypothetical protein